jgi:hypothetical protein
MTNLNDNIADDGGREVQVKDVKKGEFVRIGKSVYTRDEYCREEKRYILVSVHDVRSRLVRGSRLVEVGFTF